MFLGSCTRSGSKAGVVAGGDAAGSIVINENSRAGLDPAKSAVSAKFRGRRLGARLIASQARGMAGK
jgi:hypothetical protein